MHYYENKDWKLLSVFLKEGNHIQLTFDRNNEDVRAIINDKINLNIERDVKEFMIETIQSEKTLCKTVLKCLANNSYLVYKRRINTFGGPLLIKCNPDTGEMIYAKWEPFWVFAAESKNTVISLDATLIDENSEYSKYLKRIKYYFSFHVKKQNYKPINDSLIDYEPRIEGEQEDWNPDTF